MAKGSSARKVARVAAASGGKRVRKQRNIGFPVAIAAIVLAGLLLVAFARQSNQAVSANDTAPKANIDQNKPGDHWHAAYATEICGQELPPVQDGPEDKLGIHTHGDGVMHIHPFVTRAAGKGAVFGKFFDQVSVHVTDSEIRMPDEKIYREGETTCHGKPGQVVLAFWKAALKAKGKKPDKVYTGDFSKVRFTGDFAAYTLAFLPKGERPAAPSSAPNLRELGAQDGGPGVTPSTSAGSGSSVPPSSPPTSAVTPTAPSAKDGSTGTTSAKTGTTKL